MYLKKKSKAVDIMFFPESIGSIKKLKLFLNYLGVSTQKKKRFFYFPVCVNKEIFTTCFKFD